MQLKDVLHYYMGQRYSIPNGQGEVNVLTLVALKFAVENENGNGSEVKLHLRSLADMTEEERKHIWLLLVKRPFPNSGNVHWFEETSRLAKRCCMMSGLDRVGIGMSGHVWWDCDLNVQKYNPHIITHYLLQQGFDLWDLIPSGLAVDLKTIQQ